MNSCVALRFCVINFAFGNMQSNCKKNNLRHHVSKSIVNLIRWMKRTWTKCAIVNFDWKYIRNSSIYLCSLHNIQIAFWMHETAFAQRYYPCDVFFLLLRIFYLFVIVNRLMQSQSNTVIKLFWHSTIQSNVLIGR